MTVVWGGDEFVRRVVLPSMQVGLLAAGVEVQKAIQLSINGPSPSMPGTPPGADQGVLRNSVAVVKTGELSVGIGTNKGYGRHLEFGAVLRSKTGKWLTIPLNDEAKKLRRRTASLRSVKLRAVKSKRGNLLLVKDVGGRNKRTTPMFLLRRQTALLARPWLRPGLAKNKGRAQDKFMTATAAAIRRAAQVTLAGGA